MNRNDPCFCGSGRKYKRCHGATTSPPTSTSGAETFARRSEITRANACKRLDMELNEQLLHYAQRRFGRTWIPEGISRFTGGLTEAESETERSLLATWMLYHRGASDSDEDVRPVADIWREEHRLYREATKDRLVKAHLDAPLGIWEVQSIEPGVGSQLTDLLSGEERFVYDASSTATLEPWLGLLAYVVDCDGISFFGGLHLQPLPPTETNMLVKEIRRLTRVRTKPVSLEFRTDPDAHVHVAALWRAAQHQLEHKFDNLVMQNTDGHVIAPQSDHFELHADRKLVVKRLAKVAGAQPPERIDDDDVIMVMQPPSARDTMPGNTVVGRLIVSSVRLTIETNSVERADALRNAVEAAVDDAIRFQLRVSENMESVRHAAQRQSKSAPAVSYVDPRADTPPELQAMLQQFYAQHTATWADIGLPALEGMTPRAAANDRRMRPRLETLLKDLEQKESSSPAGLRMDIPAIRRALGL